MPKATIQQQEAKRRTVYKPILENPYTKFEWPIVEEDVAKVLINLLCELFSPYANQKEPSNHSTFTVGFNETNKVLEDETESKDPLRYVFVCRSDLPPLVSTHFPLLCATAAAKTGTKCKLIQLPRGSMAKLSAAIGVKDTGVFGLRGSASSSIARIADDSIGDCQIPWIQDTIQWTEPNIKFLQTTAPMKHSKKS